jgi:hypothetical protein
MVPTKLAPLAPRQVFYMANGRTVVKRMERTTHSAELIVATMRDSVHAVAFAWRGPADRDALLRALTESPSSASPREVTQRQNAGVVRNGLDRAGSAFG